MARKTSPTSRPGSSAHASQPRVLVGHRSEVLRSAVSRLPTEQFSKYLDNRFKDRASVANDLREYRSTTLGRSAPSSFGLATAKGRGAEFAVSQVGKAVQKFNPYRPGLKLPGPVGFLASAGTAVYVGNKAMEGFAVDGARGALRGAVNGLTWGQGGKLVDKVLGEPSIAQQANRLFSPESPGQTGARQRAEMINKRPTMAGMKAIAKAEGKPKPKKVGETKEMVDSLNSVAAGMWGGMAAVVGTHYLAEGVNAIGRGIVKAAPLASRHPVGMAVAVGGMAAAGIAAAVANRSKPAAASPGGPAGRNSYTTVDGRAVQGTEKQIAGWQKRKAAP